MPALTALQDCERYKLRRLVANRLAGSVLLMLTLWPLTLVAQSGSAIEACAQLRDDQARLACFDREVAAQKAREALHSQPSAAVPAHVAAAPAAAAPQLTEEQKMGLTPARIQQLEKPPGAPPPLKELTVTVESISVDGNGHQMFTLGNGQIWRQVELDGSFSIHPGDSVVISRGVSNSYFMSFGKHRNTRVSRVH
jgi:hypothetical protein